LRDKYLTVTALTKYMKKKIDLDPHLQQVWLKGEISNFNHHSRGHMYLTIKDDKSRIQAVMFRGNNRHLKFMPEDGMNVLIRGNISVFEPYGNYQIYIRHMEPDGIGSLYLAYEQLKEKLERSGYFAAHHKREIPKYPNHIAIITSPTGAAVRDIVTTIKRRFPIVKLTIIPVIVQGEEAAESIITGINQANSLGHVDTIIIGRGGGSIEDLWCFNDERVVKAIFHSSIPVISAIGHETDVTISDFVADLRAATPTGAGELAVPSIVELQNTIQNLQARLTKLAQLIAIKKSKSVHTLRNSYAFHFPRQLLNEKEQYVDRLTDKLRNCTQTMFQEKKTNVNNQTIQLRAQHPEQRLRVAREGMLQVKRRYQKEATTTLQHKQKLLYTAIDKLTLLNPLHIMKRGFALPYQEDGKIVKSVEQLKRNEQLSVTILDGSFTCQVREIRRDNSEKKQ